MDTPALVRGDALDGPAADAARPTTTRRATALRGGRRCATPDEVAKQALALVVALVVTLPLATITVLWHSPGGASDLNRSVVTAPFDLVLVLTSIWALAHLDRVTELFSRSSLRVAVGAYAALFAFSFAFRPSWLGLVLGLRLATGLAVIAALATACGSAATRRATLVAISAVGVVQALLAMAQSAHGVEAFGISYVDFPGKLYPFGSSFAGRGGLTHPYHLAVLLLVAQGAALLGYRDATEGGRRDPLRWAWLGAVAVLGAGIGVTYSRSAVLGQIGLGVCVLLSRTQRRRMLPVLLAIGLGLAVGAASFGDGWVARGQTTADTTQVDTGRRTRLQESAELMRSSPIVGVGPGRYVEALARKDRIGYLPAHNLVAQQGAELGVMGYLTSAALLGLLAVRAWRGGAWTAALVAPIVPYLLLDAYPYVFATGLAVSALWLGLVRTSLRPAPTADADPIEPA